MAHPNIKKELENPRVAPPPAKRQKIQLIVSKKTATFYVAGEDAQDAAVKFEYTADLDMLKKHSKLFNETFVNGDERCRLDLTEYNSNNEFIGVLDMMRHMEDHTLPSPRSLEERFKLLFDMWLCGHQIRSTTVTHYVMVYMIVMIRRTNNARYSLSTQLFNKYWNRTDKDEHRTLRKMMVVLLVLSPTFRGDHEVRSQMLKELSEEVKDLAIHQMIDLQKSPRVRVEDIVSTYD